MKTVKPKPIPRRRVLAESVYETIKEWIMDLSIPPDSHINIDQLARDLEVSNTPVREALTRLQTEGLVQRKNLQGFRTTNLMDEGQIRDLFAVRSLLEPAATGQAARRGPDADLAKALRESLEEMRAAQKLARHQAELRYRTFAEADARFHATIAAAAGNPLLATTLSGLNSHAHSYRLYFQVGMSDLTLAEHRAILDAVARADATGASSAMEGHLEQSLSRLLRAFSDDRDGSISATRAGTQHTSLPLSNSTARSRAGGHSA